MSACIAAGVLGTGTSSSSNLPSSNDTSSGESFISPAIDVELLIAPKRYSPSKASPSAVIFMRYGQSVSRFLTPSRRYAKCPNIFLISCWTV